MLKAICYTFMSGLTHMSGFDPTEKLVVGSYESSLEYIKIAISPFSQTART